MHVVRLRFSSNDVGMSTVRVQEEREESQCSDSDGMMSEVRAGAGSKLAAKGGRGGLWQRLALPAAAQADSCFGPCSLSRAVARVGSRE